MNPRRIREVWFAFAVVVVLQAAAIGILAVKVHDHVTGVDRATLEAARVHERDDRMFAASVCHRQDQVIRVLQRGDIVFGRLAQASGNPDLIAAQGETSRLIHEIAQSPCARP